MNNEQKEYQINQEPFPYKTYDEILTEKARRKKLQHGLVVMTGIFLMLCSVVIGISMVWSNSSNPFQIITQTAENKGFILGDNTVEPPNADADIQPDGDFQLPVAPAQAAANTELMYVTDVSAMVKKAIASVVGIEAEIYSGYIITRTGSGIILTENGYIITNSHVISGCDSINVTLDGGESYSAFVVGDDSYSDIAVLKIAATGLTPAELGDSDLVEVGQPAVAIGNPTGQLQGTTTFGIISGVNRNVMVNNTVMNLIQTDCAINSGNSGGPLLNQQGQVIGINSAKVSISGYEGLGFSIPINTARPIAEQLVRNGSVAGRPVLGVTCSKLSAMASNFYGLPEGLYLSAVDGACNGYEAGLQAGDVITHINDVRVKNLSEAYAQRNLYQAGETVRITVYRRGKTQTVSVCLADQQLVSSDCNF